MQKRRRNHVYAITDREVAVTRQYRRPNQPDRYELAALRKTDDVPVRKIPARPERIFGAACPLLRLQPERAKTDNDPQNQVPDNGPP